MAHGGSFSKKIGILEYNALLMGNCQGATGAWRLGIMINLQSYCKFIRNHIDNSTYIEHDVREILKISNEYALRM
jgi:hypothetical protein